MLAPARIRMAATIVAAVVAAFAAHGWTAAPAQSGAGSPDGVRFPITSAQRHGALRFAPGVSPDARQAILAAIAGARPQARRLVDAVAGAVTFHVGAIGHGDAGLTEAHPGGFDVTVDLGLIAPYGPRAVSRVVLHELGHVVDFALVPHALAARLDAEIPRGYGCPPGEPISGCAPADERFAETFAKWATGDLGFNMPLGYAVAPPADLDAWGAPLAALVGAGAS